MPPLTPPSFPGLLLALAIGFLIGVERGWHARGEEAGARVAGIRTFSIIGLLGGLIGTAIAGPLSLFALLLGGGAIAALLLGYVADIRRDNNVSATTAFAGIVTLALGALATSGQMALASVGAGATMILLASRTAMHRALQLMSEADLNALLRLVLVVCVVLPLLPNEGMGPFGALNPWRLWMVVVVTVGISFAGYVLARFLGPKKGTLVTAVVGALVSSTAVTLDSARRARAGEAGPADDAAVAIASTIMFARGLLLVGLLADFAWNAVAALLAPAALVSIVASAILLYRVREGATEPAETLLKPPGLGLAFLFAVTVAAMALATAFVEARYGGGSGAVVIALGGTADIDAAIAAVGALPPGSMPVHMVALALATPVLLNTTFKLILLGTIGGWRRTLGGLASLGAAILALALTIAIAAFSSV